MMGQHSRSESLFYYFRIEDQVPENHLLRRLQTGELLKEVRLLKNSRHPIESRTSKYPIVKPLP